jgi:hypothetical protein
LASNNNISDLFELTYLSNLKHLELDSNNINDIESLVFLNMLDKIEFINIGNNPLINNDEFNILKINEFFIIKKIEGTKFDLDLFNVDKLEEIPKEKLNKLEGKFIEYTLRTNNSKIKLCKNIYNVRIILNIIL